MRRPVAALTVAACVATGAAGGAAIAGGGDNDGPGEASASAIGGAHARYARLVAVVDRDGSVIRSKGVKAVTNPDPGIYCIRPVKKARIKFGRYVPSVSVEWGNSAGDGLLAQWHANASHCSARRIEVHTYNGDDGSWDPDGNVAFTVVVP